MYCCAQVGEVLPVGTIVGKAGNSGTTYVPHLHAAFGYTDNNSRYNTTLYINLCYGKIPTIWTVQNSG